MYPASACASFGATPPRPAAQSRFVDYDWPEFSATRFARYALARTDQKLRYVGRRMKADAVQPIHDHRPVGRRIDELIRRTYVQACSVVAHP